ncbi:hypothetical protein ES705_11526 [subsurface metagenome]
MPKDVGYKNYNSDENEKKSGKSSDNYDLLDIWRVNPRYRDLDTKTFIIRGSVSIILLLAISMSLYFLTRNIYLTVILLFPILFIYFFDQGKRFLNKVFNLFNKAFYIHPFGDLEFFVIKDEPSTLLLINKKVSSTVALRVFKVEILPENLQPTLNQFLKSLASSQLSFSYQVSHKPIIDLRTQKVEGLKENKSQAKDGIPSTISIFFSVYCHKKGILKGRRLNYLLNNVEDYSNELKSEFTANFHHTKIRLLQTKELLEAVRGTTYNIPTDFGSSELKEVPKNSYIFNIFLKSVFSLFLVILISIILFSINFSSLLVLTIDALFLYYLFFVWWRDVLFFFSNRTLYLYEDIKVVNLFPDTKFFQYKRFQTVIFANIQNKMLIGVKLLNLGAAVQPMLAYPDKFFRAINNHKLYFNYFVNATPADERMLSKECFNHYNKKTRDQFTIAWDDIPKFDKNDYPLEDYQNWLEMRSGIWKTYLSIAINCYEEIDPNSEMRVLDMVYELEEKAVILKKSFEQNFLRLRLVEVWKDQLLNGFVSNALKTRDFNFNNTGLDYLYFQGKNLINLISISNEFKKGLETRIAAEFNTPLHLKNDLLIGKTINTEMLENEVELGFTYDQVKRLLVTNGLPEQRELTTMRIVAELIQKEIPSIVFDFSGNWSKIIPLFQNTDYKDSVLIFQLGHAFSLELLSSEMDYDPENIEYLNLFFDVFALAFKEQKRTVDLLKMAVKNNENMSLTSLELGQEMESEFLKKNDYNSLITILQGFIDWRKFFFSHSLKHEHDINTIDFIRNDKTIIIDLSLLEEVSQKLFVSFVIISKLIHYTKYFDDFQPKNIVIPNIDLFFDAYFIDNNANSMDYGKIDKFLATLLQKGFGFIFSANQIHYLHHNVLNYLPNIISFKAADKRDIAMLKNQMNLQELHGTGYYSSKRNNTYQIDYLMNLQEQEVIIKRADVNQPFPGIIGYKEISRLDSLSPAEIISYMKRQGYNLEDHEQRIIARAKQTLFEKDLGIYVEFMEDIISFLGAISKFDKVAGLTESKLKEELLKFIRNTALKKVQGRKKITELRNSLFQILKTQGYLVEDHPRRASGGESIRTCYKVGDKYRKAVEDFYRVKGEDKSIFVPNVIKNEGSTNFPEILATEPSSQPFNGEFKKVYEDVVQSSYLELGYINFLIEKEKYQQSLNLSKTFIDSLFSRLYENYLKIERLEKDNSGNRELFINGLVESKLIPYSREEIQEYVEFSRDLGLSTEGIENKAVKLCEILNQFYNTLISHIKRR